MLSPSLPLLSLKLQSLKLLNLFLYKKKLLQETRHSNISKGHYVPYFWHLAKGESIMNILRKIDTILHPIRTWKIYKQAKIDAEFVSEDYYPDED